MKPIYSQASKRNGHLKRRYLARRLEILRAAGREFRVRGFAETGMRDIAAAAALSPANLYNYFRGKHDILFFCQDNSLDRMIAALEKSRRMRSSATTKLRMVIVSHLRCVLDEVEGSAAHLLTTTLPPRQQRNLVAKRDKYEAGVRNLIVAGMRSGEFAPCDPALAVRAILGSLNWTANVSRNCADVCGIFDPRPSCQARCFSAAFYREGGESLSQGACFSAGQRAHQPGTSFAR